MVGLHTESTKLSEEQLETDASTLLSKYGFWYHDTRLPKIINRVDISSDAAFINFFISVEDLHKRLNKILSAALR